MGEQVNLFFFDCGRDIERGDIPEFFMSLDILLG